MNSQNKNQEDVEGERERGGDRHSSSASTVLMSENREAAGANIEVVSYFKNDDQLSSTASTVLMPEYGTTIGRNASVYKDDRLMSPAQSSRAISEPVMGERSFGDLVSELINDLVSDQQEKMMDEVDCIPLETTDVSYNFDPPQCEVASEISVASVVPATESLEVKSTPQDEVASVISVTSIGASETSAIESIKPVTGKRRRCQVLSDSETCESDVGISGRLRSRKTRVIEAMIDSDKNELTSHTGAFSSCVASMASETDGSTLLDSEPESAKQKKTMKKDEKVTKKEGKAKKASNRKRASPIAYKLHPVNVDVEQLNDYPTASLVAQALEWVEDIDMIRVKSSFQGVISKNVKERLEIIKACFQVLHTSSLGVNDSSQLKLRNARLAADYHAAQEEILQLKLDMAKMRKDHKDEMMTITSRSRKTTCCSSTSPIRDVEHKVETEMPSNGKMDNEIMDIKNRILQLESNINKIDKPVELPETRPLREEFPALQPLPQRQPRAKPVIKSIEKICPEKRVIIKTMPKSTSNYLPHNLPGMSMDVESPAGPAGPIVHDAVDPGVDSGAGGNPCVPGGPNPSVVAIPEKEKEDIKKKKMSSKYGEETDGNESRGEWTAIKRKKKKKSRSKIRKSGGEKSDNEAQSGKESSHRKLGTENPKPAKSAIQILQKKIPKASAVVIKGKTSDFSYAEALIKLRKQIPLEELGINATKIKKTTNGAVLIEIPGSDTKDLAGELRSRAADVLGEEAAVSCPEVKGEIRIVGFDESVSASDIALGISKAGGCKTSEVAVTPIIPMRNGLCMTWIKCPIAAALKASKAGKIPLGWTLARLELQKPRKMRCFKCWELGHHRNACKSVEDRTRACFRCGENGHSAASCTKEAHCVLCAAKGVSARHRTGSHKCEEETGNKATIEKNLDRRPVPHNTLDNADTPE